MKTSVISPEFRDRYLSNPKDPEAFEGTAMVFDAKVADFCSMCGPKFCSMELTQQVRDYANTHDLTSVDALKEGMKEKSAEFKKAGEINREDPNRPRADQERQPLIVRAPRPAVPARSLIIDGKRAGSAPSLGLGYPGDPPHVQSLTVTPGGNAIVSSR